MRHIFGSVVVLCAFGSSSVAEPQLRSRYATEGDLEIGASAGGMLAADLRVVNVAGSIGWYIADRVALTSIVGVASMESQDREKTILTAYVEPSYVPELAPNVHGLIGLGMGAAYVGDLGAGLAVAPRIGARFRVGERGIVTPAVSYEHVFNNVETNEMDVVMDAALGSMRLSVGYAAFW